MTIRIKRAYEAPSPEDRARILVDRLWPRGISKEKLKLGLWMKDIAPGNELRHWLHQGGRTWAEFRKHYFQELRGHPELVAELRRKGRGHRLTLLYSARDERQNNAIALKDFLERRAR